MVNELSDGVLNTLIGTDCVILLNDGLGRRTPTSARLIQRKVQPSIQGRRDRTNTIAIATGKFFR